ncbi:MAG: hypothetical protein U0939_20010 [Pirellulales bacterium]
MADESEKSYLSCRIIKVDDVQYRADFDLHDRFQGFSAELLKLSLGGLAVVGFFLSTINSDKPTTFAAAAGSGWFSGCILASVGLFAVATVLSLAHRFLASDGMFHHLRAIKYLTVLENLKNYPDLVEDKDAACKLRIKAEKDESERNTKYQWSERFLYLSGAALAGAAVFLGLSFAILLGSAKPNATHIQEAKAGGRVGLEWESFSSGTQTLDR